MVVKFYTVQMAFQCVPILEYAAYDGDIGVEGSDALTNNYSTLDQ
jgi:hypothetical protein